MATDVASVIGAAFGASILTTVGSRWVAGYQAKKAAEQRQLDRDHDRDQARLADARSLRDAKRERLRGDYFAVAYAADTLGGVAKELSVRWSGETEDARNERLNKQLADATDELGRAMLRLRLEEGTQPMVESFQRLRAAWFTYSDYEVRRFPRDHSFAALAGALSTIGSEVDGIIAMARADLDALGKPV